MLLVVMNQTIRPKDTEKLDNLFFILDKLLSSVPLYRLKCDISTEAAQTSFRAMVENKI